MAKAKVVHSEDAVTVIFKGNPKSPEPSTGIIKFPGGHVEVTRCSDNQYWAHLYIDEESENTQTRVMYNYERQQKLQSGIGDIPYEKEIEQLAVKVKGVYKSYE